MILHQWTDTAPGHRVPILKCKKCKKCGLLFNKEINKGMTPIGPFLVGTELEELEDLVDLVKSCEAEDFKQRLKVAAESFE